MPETIHYGLYLTTNHEEKFLTWRKKMAGQEDSNMVKIDKALGDLNKDKACKSATFTISIPASKWIEKQAIIEDERFIANGFSYMVCPAGKNYIQYCESVVYAEDVTEDGKLTLRCDMEPTVDLLVNILRIEVI